jgi:hypothetical protein
MGRRQLLALKRPTVALAEGLLIEAVLKHACVCRTAARDPRADIGRVLDERCAAFLNCLPDRRNRPQRWMSRQAGFMGLRL